MCRLIGPAKTHNVAFMEALLYSAAARLGVDTVSTGLRPT
jgi:hypothetical protein